MTLEEAKELELKIANEILNNTPLATVVRVISDQAKASANKVMNDSSEEQLAEIKANFEKAEAEAAEKQKAAEEALKVESEEPPLRDND